METDSTRSDSEVAASPRRRAFDTRVRDKAIQDRRRRLAAEQGELLQRVRQALLELREPLGVRAAYIVGPVLWPEFWSETSAIAVAVEGCSSALLDIMKALEDATGRVVNVIDLDRHPFPDSFVCSGVRVYG
jgi:hypothetical protein